MVEMRQVVSHACLNRTRLHNSMIDTSVKYWVTGCCRRRLWSRIGFGLRIGSTDVGFIDHDLGGSLFTIFASLSRVLMVSNDYALNQQDI